MELSSVAAFEDHAKKVLTKNAWDYYSCGAGQGQTLRDNTEAFSRYRFRPRMLRDVSKVDMRVQILGEWVEFPICVSPTAAHKIVHPEGEIATARACSKLGTCLALGTWSSVSMEEVAASCSGLKWYQIYVFKDREITKNMVLRAEKAGYKAIVLTVDVPLVGGRLKEESDKFQLPPHFLLANVTKGEKVKNWENLFVHNYDSSMTWKIISWLRGITKLPIVVKGLLTREDALEAVKHGVQGIVVSNHGGRQLDGELATIDALSEVLEAVGDKMEVFLDGGVRKGTDVLKALALGAKAVFIGRPVLWGLAYNGSEGVEKVINILKEELRKTMALVGCAKISDITPELVVHESFYRDKPRLQSRL